MSLRMQAAALKEALMTLSGKPTGIARSPAVKRWQAIDLWVRGVAGERKR